MKHSLSVFAVILWVSALPLPGAGQTATNAPAKSGNWFTNLFKKKEPAQPEAKKEAAPPEKKKEETSQPAPAAETKKPNQ